jgi:hypothetical protein
MNVGVITNNLPYIRPNENLAHLESMFFEGIFVCSQSGDHPYKDTKKEVTIIFRNILPNLVMYILLIILLFLVTKSKPNIKM